jgi:hypothetical protein
MKPYHATLALVLILLLGWAAVGHADGRGGGPGHGGRPSFQHGNRGPGFHGTPGAFRGHPGGFHGHPGFHGRAFIGAGPLFLWGPGYFYTPPPVVAAPPVYVQPGSAGYWYYCPGAQAYYPNVPSCSEPWVLVPAS